MFVDGRPLFQQIAEQLAHDILDGTYPEESAVPSTNELAQFLRVNPATAGKGLNLLVNDGILYKKRGIGMFVTTGARDRLVEARTRTFTQDFVAPMLREAAKLGMTATQLAHIIQQEESA